MPLWDGNDIRLQMIDNHTSCYMLKQLRKWQFVEQNLQYWSTQAYAWVKAKPESNLQRPSAYGRGA